MSLDILLFIVYSLSTINNKENTFGKKKKTPLCR